MKVNEIENEREKWFKQLIKTVLFLPYISDAFHVHTIIPLLLQ